MELFEDRYGYEVEEEEYESEPGPVRRATVYAAPAINTEPVPTTALAVVTQPGQAAPGLAIREPVIQEQQQVGVDGERASVSAESENTAAHRNMFGFLANGATGQGTSALPNPPPPRFLSDLPVDLAAIANPVTPAAAAAQVRATDPARVNYEQQMASLQQCFD